MDQNHKNKELCLKLMNAATCAEVKEILSTYGYWDKPEIWRYYGDRASNYNTIGNQQGSSVPALVEKLINSIDAKLISECRLQKINPESKDAPSSTRKAVAKFFDPLSKSSSAGLIREWPNEKRTRFAKEITLSATGNLPRVSNPCFVISDLGEGQSPLSLPKTILSLDKENKVKIPFVQGKFNMGGTGVLEFCGPDNLELVISKKHPLLSDPSEAKSDEWGFTIVRREDPGEGRKSSTYTYLAPVNCSGSRLDGEVLSFKSDKLKIFPDGNDAYAREAEWGTCIKLFEYSTKGFDKSNSLMGYGLLHALDLYLPEAALPIRVHECRDYGGKAGSYETNLLGINVRLDDDRQQNLESIPFSASLSVLGEKLTARIYVFKKDKKEAYKKREGVLFTVNGQTHAILDQSIFKRAKIKLDYIADSMLILINCSDLTARAREMLFMPSRDRLRENDLEEAIEKELEILLSSNESLKKLNEQRRLEETKSRLKNDAPLKDILASIIRESPTLSKLFITGQDIPNPFDLRPGQNAPEEYIGKKFPTYFKIKNKKVNEKYHRNCPINHRAQILFETDADNDYFQREIQPGSFEFYLVDEDNKHNFDHTLNLSNGVASLNVNLPVDSQIGDVLNFLCETFDETSQSPFINEFALTIIDEVEDNNSPHGNRAAKPTPGKSGERELPSSFKKPEIILVSQSGENSDKTWEEMTPPFTDTSTLTVNHGENDGGYDFFVNIDNKYLLAEQKRKPLIGEILQKEFIYSQVLIGLGVLRELEGEDSSEILNELEIDALKVVELVSQGVAPFVIPMVRELKDIIEQNPD